MNLSSEEAVCFPACVGGDPVTEFSAAPALPVEIMRRGEPGGKTRAEDTGRDARLAKAV